MMKVVEMVSKNPLAKINSRGRDASTSNEFGSVETDLLEKTFVKIAGLLRVGFGEAGAGIIKSNLSLNGDNSTLINPLLPGIRVYCIIGFCDIHQFDFVLQRLKSDVLVFVNTVASIVHERVHAWEGSCNKNLGNAFILIWRIGDEASLKQQNDMRSVGYSSKRKEDEQSIYLSDSDRRGSLNKSTSSNSKAPALLRRSNAFSTRVAVSEIDLKRTPGVDKLAGKALIAFLKIIASIDRNIDLPYSVNSISELSHKKPYTLKMGFGLHAGWAIEGAVGSLQKVDATYLSPHVNMAARLETSSRQYGVPLLASQAFYELLSPYIQKLMRRLDVVTVKGSAVPIGIYTYDTISQHVMKDLNSTSTSKIAAPPTTPGTPRVTKSHTSSASMLSSPIMTPNLRMFRRSSNDNDIKDLSLSEKNMKKQRHSICHKKKRISVFTSGDEPDEVLAQDSDLVNLRSHINNVFIHEFGKGVNKYITGDWLIAKGHFEKSDAIMKEILNANNDDTNIGDGPSQTLLNYMATYQYIAPDSWSGFRPLTSK